MKHKNEKSFIIESFGPIGSGKSTIFMEIKRLCEKNNIVFYSDSLFKKIPLFHKIDILYLIKLVYLLITIQIPISKFYKYLITSYSSYVKIKYYSKRKGVYLIDQGPMQYYGTILKHAKSKKAKKIINNFILSNYICPSLIIIPIADKATIKERVYSRDSYNLSLNRIEQMIKRRNFLESILKKKDICCERIVKISSDETLNDKIQELFNCNDSPINR